MNLEKKNSLYLFVVTAFWGSSYVLTKICLKSVGEFHIISFRFFLSFCLCFPILYKKMRPISKESYKYSFLLALILFLVFVTMNFGLRETTASNAGFLAGLSVVFIPFLDWFINKKKPKERIFLSLFPVTLGIFLMSFDNEFNLYKGDILCLACSIFFSLHVVLTGKFVKKVSALAIGVLQFLYLSLFSLVFQIPIEGFTLPTHFSFWVSVFILSVFCTAFGYMMQAICQEKVSPILTGFIFSLEPVFSAVFGYFLLGEILSFRQGIGATLLFLSILWLSFHEKVN